MKRDLLYSGKAKNIYSTDDPSLCVLEHRDDATALNGLKKGSFEDKGVLNNTISAQIFELLAENGVPTHFVKKLSDRETLAKVVKIIPLEVIIRNVAAGSFSKKYGVEEGSALKSVVLEYSLKDDDLGDPLINDSHILALGIATAEQLDTIARYTLRVNELLRAFFLDCNLILVDFKIEFGTTEDGEILLADEFSPDSCRLWDKNTGEKMDKDRFRRDMGGFAEAYKEVLRRMKE